MDSGFDLKRENPRESANIFSKLLFAWMVKLCYKGTKKGLKIIDLYKTLQYDKSEYLTNKLEKYWDDEVLRSKVKGTTPSLYRALRKVFFWMYMLYGLILFFLFFVIRSFQPMVLGYFINLFSLTPEEDSEKIMYLTGSLLVLMSLLAVLTTHHLEFAFSSMGMRIRVAVSSLIYRKILKLSQKSLGQTAAGHVVNLLSNDVNRFDMVMTMLHYLWITPPQVILVTYLIWRQVQISALAGVLSMVLLTLPVQGYLGKLTSKLRLQIAERTDLRVKLMNEVISGIQVIKMYAWEQPFEEIIKYARKKEIDVLTKASYLRGIFSSCMVFIERATLFLTVVSFVLMGNVITADKVFSMAQFFNLLQLVMAICYPMAISLLAETWVSIKRLQEFLIQEEKPSGFIDKSSKDKSVELENVNATWVSPETLTLKNFSLVIPSGCLCAIIGPVGAGKSSTLQLLLGELAPNIGRVKVGGTISYSSQEPWLFASTVRNNILFGQTYDKLHYKAITKVCALEKDFQQFPQGDRTMVGDRGVSLSGGQRARINFARSIYRQADIYLMDDPLSAVDTHVGKHLFEECIVKYLRGKTRILVTHQLQHLQKADLIVVINNGQIEATGTFQELSNSELDFTKMLNSGQETAENKAPVDQFEPIISIGPKFERKVSILSTISLMSDISVVHNNEENEEELGDENSTPLRDYISAAGNWCTIPGLIFILLLGQVMCSAADYWITFWTQHEALRFSDNIIKIRENSSDFYDEITEEMGVYYVIKTNPAIYIYTGLIVAAIIFTLLRSFAFFTMVMTASRNLHNKMFHALLKAPMRFFDTNPSGRILNRFSKDMGAIDELLPRVLLDAIQILLVMSGILTMITIANYYMVIAIVLIGAFFVQVRNWYLATAKDIKHLEGIAKSPVFSHLSSSLNGITTIRASGAEDFLKHEFDHHQDVHTSAWFLTIACRICYGLWLDLISVLFVAFVVFGFIILNQYGGGVNASLVGLAISQSLILTGMLQYGMRQTAEVVNQLTSVERVMQYTKLEDEHCSTEKQSSKDAKAKLEIWPTQGLIKFKNLSLRYSQNNPPVLNNLNILIEPGMKIGIVGRTGAGKSSLISALFRLAPIEGNIYIDGQDTKLIKLTELRSKISIIPQEPVLFSASIRYNLDPFNEYNDQKLWDALEDVELKESVPSLDLIVSGGGSNFSLGQRQLICLARAILRNNKILVLDEATANVDPQTDALIQSAIREKFKNCTVLTIAHRLNTIMDSDKALVMDAGRAVEFDHPHLLLENIEGVFYGMVQNCEPATIKTLTEIARRSYQQQNDQQERSN